MGIRILNDPTYQAHLKKTGSINKAYMSGSPLTVARIDRIVQEAKGEVLDMGCNGGIVSVLMAQKGCTVTGIDFLESQIAVAEMLKAGQERSVANRLHFMICNAEETGMASAKFDTVVIGQLLEHVISPRKILDEGKRVMKSKGKALISVPIGYNRSKNHIRWFTKEIFTALIQDYFRVDKLLTFSGTQMLIIGTKTGA